MNSIETTTTLQDERWQAVLDRAESAEGAFVYGVRSTKIYCRPTCPSRRPARERVEFFDRPAQAEEAGYRPCRRCRPDQSEAGEGAALRACRVIERRLDHGDESPDLNSLAAEVGLTASHLQRVFKRATGVTPREYADSHRLKRFKEGLRAGDAVGRAIVDAGYGSTSRIYERVKSQLGMTPSEYRRGSGNVTVGYTVVDSPLGRLLIAATEKGVCAVTLGETNEELVDALRREYPQARLSQDRADLNEAADSVLRHLSGALPDLRLPLDVRATAFQRQVWQALQAIPRGETRSYSQIAASIGRPTAARAVARACASNPVALAVPCHRVVRGDGSLSGYRWGVERKAALLAQEKAARLHGGNDASDQEGAQL